jgi:hypothetical protein
MLEYVNDRAFWDLSGDDSFIRSILEDEVNASKVLTDSKEFGILAINHWYSILEQVEMKEILHDTDSGNALLMNLYLNSNDIEWNIVLEAFYDKIETRIPDKVKLLIKLNK